MVVMPVVVGCERGDDSAVLARGGRSGPWTAECGVKLRGGGAKFKCECSVQNLRREQVGGLIHVNRSCNEEIARQGEPLRVAYGCPSTVVVQLKLWQEGLFCLIRGSQHELKRVRNRPHFLCASGS